MIQRGSRAYVVATHNPMKPQQNANSCNRKWHTINDIAFPKFILTTRVMFAFPSTPTANQARLAISSNSRRHTRSARGSTKRRRDDLGFNASGARSRLVQKGSAHGTTRKWVQVRRPPAPKISFSVLMWVPLDQLTEAELLEYERKKTEKQTAATVETSSSDDTPRPQDMADLTSQVDPVSLQGPGRETDEEKTSGAKRNLEETGLRINEEIKRSRIDETAASSTSAPEVPTDPLSSESATPASLPSNPASA